MGKTKMKELPDISLSNLLCSIVNDKQITEKHRAINQRNYFNLVEAKGEDYLRNRGITPPEQWDNESFREKSHELNCVYLREYHAQEEARNNREWKRIRPYGIGFLSAMILLELGLQFVGSYQKTEKEHAKADFSYCHTLLLKAQSEETKEFVKKNATGPYSGRLCELVLAEGDK